MTTNFVLHLKMQAYVMLFIDRKDISSFRKKALTAYRRDDVGFVFRFYNLVQNLDHAQRHLWTHVLAAGNVSVGK